jgi:uncharacterized protein YndB with AHSA1/START domain
MKIVKTVSINQSPSQVWEYLTNPTLMKKWMGEPEMNIEVVSNWKIGNSIHIKGFHNGAFDNKGIVLQFDSPKILQYSHLSSASQLDDVTENHSIIIFRLTPINKNTLLKIQIENFPTESIQKHLDFYWQGTASVLKNIIEQEKI